MAEFSRITYDFNSRIVLNDETSDTDKFVVLNTPNLTDTLTIATEEVKPEEPGIIDYGSKFGKGQWVVPVTIYGSDFSNLNAMIQTVKQAFNPDLLEKDTTYGEGTKWNGYHPLDWTETVGGTSRDFRIYAKATEIPQIAVDSFSGLIRKADISLKIADPRKYLQATTSLAGSGTATNAGTYTTPAKITITATGASSTSLQITNTTTGQSIYVTTALADGEVLVIDTAIHSVKLDGVEKRSMLGNNTIWWFLDPGDNTITVSNDTNVTVSTEWRSAWPL